MSLQDEDLRRPLYPRGPWQRLAGMMPRPAAALSVLVLAISVVAVVAVMRLDPGKGEPQIRIAMPKLEETPLASITPIAEIPEEAPPLPEAEAAAPEPDLAPAPFAGLTEKGPDGLLPRIGKKGKRPADAYARPVPEALLREGAPRVAILIGGLGLNEGLTRQALELDPEISLALAPYGQDLQALANEARARGHELVLQLPMEPFGYPALADPGPHMLRAGPAASGNGAELDWLLSRFQGYFAVMNYLGAKCLADEAAMSALLEAVSRRGLDFLADGTLRAIPTAGPRVAMVDLRLDGQSKTDVLAKLRALEARARADGIAVGLGTGLDVTMDAVAEWAREAAGRGIVLVPVSAAFQLKAAASAQSE